MTLILATMCSRYAVLVSDRRITAGAEVRSEEMNKAFLFRSPTLIGATAFSGLATTPHGFRTSEWLAKALQRTLQRGMDFDVNALAEDADETFDRLPIRSVDKLVWILFVAFRGHPRGSQLVVARMTNGSLTPAGQMTADRFRFEIETAEPGDPAVASAESVGLYPTVPPRDLDLLRDLALSGRPAQAVVGKSVETLHRAADAPKADAKIGRQATSITLFADSSRNPQFGYYSSFPTKFMYSPGVVSADHLILESYFEKTDHGYAVVPKVRGSRSCPCGQPRKYAACHGRRHRATG